MTQYIVYVRPEFVEYTDQYVIMVPDNASVNQILNAVYMNIWIENGREFGHGIYPDKPSTDLSYYYVDGRDAAVDADLSHYPYKCPNGYLCVTNVWIDGPYSGTPDY